MSTEQRSQWLDEEALTPRQAQRVRQISRRMSNNSLLMNPRNSCPYVETITPAQADAALLESQRSALDEDDDNDHEGAANRADRASTGGMSDARAHPLEDADLDELAHPEIPEPPRTVPLWRWLTKRAGGGNGDAAAAREDSRRSLPALDIHETALLEHHARLHTARSNSLQRPVLDKDGKEISMFFATDSPMVPEDDVGTPHDLRTDSLPRNRNLSRPPVFTEVGQPMANMFGKPHHSQSEKLPHDSQLTSDAMPNERGNDAPRLAMQETQVYTFAIILRHTEEIFRILRRRFPSKSSASIRRDLDQQVSQLQQKAVRRLIQCGLGVLVLDNDIYEGDHDDQTEEQAAMNICILINPKKDPNLLVHEFKREMDELSILQGDANGRMAEESIDSIKQMCFSPALEMQLTHNIIQNAFKDYDKEEWVIDVNRELTVKDIIKECFPLHDRTFNKKFFAAYRKNTFSFSLSKAAAGNRDRWAIEELRLHFGERVAFLFAFMHIYTKHLMPLTAACVCYYLALRFIPSNIWKQYIEGLAVIGFACACLWGPTFLICWERETRVLVEKWNLAKYKNTVYEKNDVNPDFKYIWVKNELTHEMEKVPAPRKNHLIQTTMFFYVLVSAVLQCICVLPFIQWYVWAKNAPVCAECEIIDTKLTTLAKVIPFDYNCAWFISCFRQRTSALGTDRWFYILLQGIVLGLLIDIIFFEVFNWISEKFVKWENYRTQSEYENRLIHRRFVFVWSNWFFWFLFIAFVYLPFGDTFINLFRGTILKQLAPTHFDPGKLTLDTLFVTPLVVTQFLNMLLETFVPYIIRKLRGRPTTWRKTSPLTWCTRRLSCLLCCFRDPEPNEVRMPLDSFQGRFVTAKRLSRLIQQRTGFTVDVRAYGDDCNAYSAYEIIAESKLPVFDPVLDYLDACIQFSYVVMFTVVWPLLPFPAVLNNIFEVRGDAFRLLFAHRRPMPRRDTSIGEWATVLAYANIVGIIVVSGFVAMYHWGFFVTSACNYKFGDGEVVPFSMLNTTLAADPDACHAQHVSNSSTAWSIMVEIVVFVVLEHFGFLFRYIVLQVDKVPSSLRSTGYKRLQQIHRLTLACAAPASQFEYIQQLKALFDKFDVHHDGHLREPHLIAFLAEWICKHPTELMPYSSIIFRYMDKNGIGKVPFSTCCLMLQHVNHDRFFSCLLGLYDPQHAEWNADIRSAEDGIALRRVMSEVSSFVSHRNSASSVASMGEARSSFGRQRDSTYFYVN